MQDITNNLPNDIEALKAIILENFSDAKKLKNNITLLKSENKDLESENKDLESEKKSLEARIQQLIQEYFGRSSEKFVDPRQGVLFNECEQLADAESSDEKKVTPRRN